MQAALPSDSHWMRQALELAESVAVITSPNPRVGCVIVRDGQAIASGATQQAGGPHAEVMALRQAAERGVSVQGATVYVSLEPCSHHGRTPPCVDALVAARPARVVVAMRDPNPLVAGQGLARLHQAGIAVTEGVCADEALAMNPGFFARMTRGTPWLWLKLATSLDGRIALPDGQSQWITGPQARADGHAWRARSCVVLSGYGTVAADDPLLNVRHVSTPRQPIKAVVDTRFEINENARLFDGTPVWIFTCHPDTEKARRLADKNVTVIPLPAVNGRVDLNAMMAWMAGRSVNEVHVEAGARLSGALLQAGCVDELLVYMAPKVLGPGIGMLALPQLASLDQAPTFQFVEQTLVGSDSRLRLRDAQRWSNLCTSVLR
jgi:diaminohydroxyphosphoribosylaminopyrimidine deaminase/5-amino-6-(5-phosphoribosylamino)uracil reductase